MSKKNHSVLSLSGMYVLVPAITIIIALSVQSTAFAAPYESCMRKKSLETLLSGKWLSFNEKIGSVRYSGKSRWKQNGIEEVVASDGKKHFGTWKKKSENRYCVTFATRKPSTVCYTIKRTCP